MPDTGESSSSAGLPAGQRLRAEAAEVFTEVQRADGKGTTLCGVTGGLLTVDAAVLSSVPKGSWLPVAALACTAVLLGVALIAAVSAIRPVLPRSGGFKVLACPAAGSARPEEVLSALTAMTVGEQLRAEAERLALFVFLAERKFRAVRWAVDFTTAAVLMAGIGLLSLYVTS